MHVCGVCCACVRVCDECMHALRACVCVCVYVDVFVASAGVCVCVCVCV